MTIMETIRYKNGSMYDTASEYEPLCGVFQSVISVKGFLALSLGWLLCCSLRRYTRFARRKLYLTFIGYLISKIVEASVVRWHYCNLMRKKAISLFI